MDADSAARATFLLRKSQDRVVIFRCDISICRNDHTCWPASIYQGCRISHSLLCQSNPPDPSEAIQIHCLEIHGGMQFDNSRNSYKSSISSTSSAVTSACSGNDRQENETGEGANSPSPAGTIRLSKQQFYRESRSGRFENTAINRPNDLVSHPESGQNSGSDSSVFDVKHLWNLTRPEFVCRRAELSGVSFDCSHARNSGGQAA